MVSDAGALAYRAPSAAPATTVSAARRTLAGQLRARGIETSELDARILIGHALGLDAAALAAAGTKCLSVTDREAIAAVAQRRLAREPTARIIGRKEFWSLPFLIDGTTLVPRPETETVVEAALATIEESNARMQALRIADLGTGCGVLLLALLSELPAAFGVGSDISTGALGVARHNARRLNLTRAAFVACDLASALGGSFDVIVSNPPYIASGDIAALEPEVRDFEPRGALDGGNDGLAFYRRMATAVPALLADGGIVVVELGSGQAEPVAALFTAAGLAPSPPRPDLSGAPRALVVHKRA